VTGTVTARGGGLTSRRRSGRRPGAAAGDGTTAERGARGLGRGEAVGEIGLHLADPRLVRLGVQPEATRGTHRLQQAVAALPGSQQMVADPHAPAQLADAQQRAARRSFHGKTLQYFDKHLTIVAGPA
jgi:hypothetical protein